MRDLASRLRAIVQRPTSTGVTTPRVVADLGIGEATPGGVSLAIAGALGGRVHGPSCLVIDRVFEAYQSHGRRRIEHYVLDDTLPLALLDPRCAGVNGWAARPVFFDIETTGLGGGAGTLAFLVGCGWFEPDGFRVRQFLLTGAAGETTLLAAIGDVLGAASLIVTFNGRTFDLPFMDMRWAFHRLENPVEDVPHFDMLPPARRLWGRRGDAGCSLTALERAVLGFHRLDDVPGMEIPSRYFQFLRSGDPSVMAGVLDHNRHDVLSLALIATHALHLAQEGPDRCRDGHEQLALGRVYERAGLVDRARAAYESASRAFEPDAQAQALARLAVLLRREGQFEPSADAWRRLLDCVGADGRRRAMTPLERLAVEALAIHHEHRARDPMQAKRYAEMLRGDDLGLARDAARVTHRLGRLDRKIRATQRGDRTAALKFEV